MTISLKQVDKLFVSIYELHGKHKSKTYNIFFLKKERNPNTTLKKVIKPQGKRLKEEKNREELQKQPEDK